MSLAFDDPRAGAGATFAGGEASLGDIASAAVDQMLYVDNTLANQWALDRAIRERNDEVFAATGVRPELPFARMRLGTAGWRADKSDALEKWQRDIAEAAARIPDQNVANRLNRSIEGDAIRIARESDARLAQTMASRGGIGKWVAAFAGGAYGSMVDPINVLSLLVGGGPGAGRTVAARIVSTAAREAAINGATEASMQPMVQAWREKAGLDHGVSQALANVGFAAAFGGALGGAGQALGEGIVKLSGRALDAAGDAAAADGRVAEPLRRAMDGDLAAARETLPEIRDALPAEARGALDHIDSLDHLEANRPASAQPEHHDVTVAAAHRAVDAAEPPRFSVDAAQIERVVHSLVGDAPAVDRSNARSLLQFLKDRGGVLDQTGDLAAIGAGDLARKGRGKDKRVPLDAAREAAEEAGYIGRAGETQVTTIADLVDAIDTELRGNKIYAREDTGPAASVNFEAQRAGVERTVAEIARHAGPAVDDKIIREAAELAVADGMDSFDALERVLIRAEQNRSKVNGFDDTRGQGVQYHGAPNAIDQLFEHSYTSLNYYGQGFYTSDALDIVHGYANRKKAKSPTIYRISERRDVKTLDMEKPVPNWLVEGLEDDIVHMAMDERPRNVRELYDNIRDISRGEGLSADEVQELFETFNYRMEEHGYGAMEHIGGLRTDRQPHRVKIYFDPANDIEIAAHGPIGREVEASGRDHEPLPGWSDAELEAASAARGPEPTAEKTPFFDPAAIDPDLTLTNNDLSEFGDVMLPGASGGPQSLRAMVDDIKHGEGLAAIVKACKA